MYLNGALFDNSAGCVEGAVDHNPTSPNSAIAHNLFELEVRLTGNPGGCYSPEPAFWGATLPTVRPTAAAALVSPDALAQEGTDLPRLISAAFFHIAANGTTTLYPLADQVPTGVGAEPTLPAGVLMASPNPFVERTSILLTLPAAQEVEVSIIDLNGRRVWRLPRARMEAGQHRIPWYGQDGSGRPVKAGMYFVRVQGSSDLNLHRTVIRLR